MCFAAVPFMWACNYDNWEVGEGQSCLPGYLANPVCAKGLQCDSWGRCSKPPYYPPKDDETQDASMPEASADGGSPQDGDADVAEDANAE
jgi:hypothetical protein